MNEWGLEFFGKAELVGDLWTYMDGCKRRPLLPMKVELEGMDALYDTFNAVSPVLVANEIRIVAGQGGKQQVVRVQALHKEIKHSFTYYSLEHAAEDVHKAVEEVARTILRDYHPNSDAG